ncbi:hypothetical protein P7K49_027693 [Saguinus oedipus]|uniref:FDFT1 n=1 Tax=Saguinus oedipus TaxID=9490 RepID=A0ABQ9UB25_SAGOE|nr:hypothetical protein P7K49_027693 [Saguinus oedipus]
MEFVKCLGHPEEFYNLVRFRIGGKRKVMPKMDQVGRASLHPWTGKPRAGPASGPGSGARDAASRANARAFRSPFPWEAQSSTRLARVNAALLVGLSLPHKSPWA